MLDLSDADSYTMCSTPIQARRARLHHRNALVCLFYVCEDGTLEGDDHSNPLWQLVNNTSEHSCLSGPECGK